MPRTLVRAPGHDRARSLGWLATAWMEHFLVHGPGNVQGEPVRHGDEYTGFIVDCYAVGDNPMNNHRLYDSAFLSRPKGTDKSGLGARLVMFEAFGPNQFAGWARGGEVYTDPWGLGFEYRYEPGEPMGEHTVAPVIRCLATEEGQTANVYETVYFNLTDEDAPLSKVPGADAGLERILLPFGGKILVSTASSASKDGGRETFCVVDESHLYNTPDLRRMYATITRNLLKRKGKVATWYIETTTMFSPGQNSVAEQTFEEAEALRDGRKKRGAHRLLYDHRYGIVDKLSDEPALRQALREAYGEAMDWMDEDALVEQFWDTRNQAADSRRYFLNAQTSTQDAWIEAHTWDSCGRPEKSIQPGDLVVLGLDGSVNDDATALAMVRFQHNGKQDAHLELLGCWEKPDGPEGEDWQVDREAVDAAVAEAMQKYRVVGFFMDPAHWQDYADKWQREFGAKMKVRASDKRPMEWWTNRPRAMVSALERFHEAVAEGRLTFTPAQDRIGRQAELATTLRRHVLNARRRPSRAGLQIGKEHPKSARKIDGCMAAVIAYEAASEAIAGGVASRAKTSYVPRRIR